MAKEPTILVKQEDGTSVRMTLGEFKAWREKRTGSPSAAAPATTASPSSKASKTADEMPEVSAPAVEKKIPEPMKKEEKPSGDEPIAGMFLPKEETSAPKEQPKMSEEKKTIDPELPPPEQTKPADSTAPAKAPTPSPTESPKKPSLAEQLYRQSQSTAPLPITPKQSASPKAMAGAGMASTKPGVDPVSAPPPRTAVMGPVDEFAVISLTDFRRLSKQPAEAAKKLKEKFMTLQEESYLMFLEGVEAWKQSPLYKQYQGVLIGALESGQSLEQYLSSQKEFTLADMEALAELNSSLL